ncbi:MAG: hypothetical protein H0X24_24910 [Ktedonobacterales bacterium]|nr:hypothetical protein [Ktedonobacterales bacterium]
MVQRWLTWWLLAAALVVTVPAVRPSALAEATQPAACPTTATPLTIPLRTDGDPLSLVLSTNFDDATQLDPQAQPSAKETLRLLQAWHPPLVRLHFGFRSRVPSLPESVAGQWDFHTTDAAIANLRAGGITYVLNVRSAPPWMFNRWGRLRDPSGREFAQYMARLVGWYNKGGFTDEQGQFHASGHQGWVQTWEIWNEPNSGYEIPAPVADPGATWMQARDFGRLYDTVVRAMRAVDPSIRVGGPAMSPGGDAAYLRNFLATVRQPIDFVSLHYYPIWRADAPDGDIFAGIGTDLPARIAAAQAVLAARFAHPPPLWLDEVNLNEGTVGTLDARATAPIGYAFAAQTFAESLVQHLALTSEFQFVSNAQGGLVDSAGSGAFRAYWLYQLLGHTFPAGSRLLSATVRAGLVLVVALAPDRQSISVLLGNTAVARGDDVGGAGVPQAVCLNLRDMQGNITFPLVAPARLWRFDAQTRTDALPTPTSLLLPASGQAYAALPLTLGGYGATILSIPIYAPFSQPFAV